MCGIFMEYTNLKADFISAHARGHLLSTYAKFFRKTNIYNPLIRTRTCACQEVRKVSFSENFAYVFNGWPPICRKIVKFWKSKRLWLLTSQTSSLLLTSQTQPRDLGKKCDDNFILTFALAKVRYRYGITTAKIFVKNLLFLVVYKRCNDAL